MNNLDGLLVEQNIYTVAQELLLMGVEGFCQG